MVLFLAGSVYIYICVCVCIYVCILNFFFVFLGALCLNEPVFLHVHICELLLAVLGGILARTLWSHLSLWFVNPASLSCIFYFLIEVALFYPLSINGEL